MHAMHYDLFFAALQNDTFRKHVRYQFRIEIDCRADAARKGILR